MQKKGTMKTCDRCGKKIFVTGDYLSELDDQYWTKYEGKDMCPDCSREFENLIEDFFKCEK